MLRVFIFERISQVLIIKRTNRPDDNIVRILVPPSDKPQEIEVKVTRVDRNATKIGFTAEKSVRILRGEIKLMDEGEDEQEKAA